MTTRRVTTKESPLIQWCHEHRGFLCGWGCGLAIVLGWWL